MSVIDEPQYMRALEHANRVRLARAEVKRQVATGVRSAASVVVEQPFGTDGMTVRELLMAQHRWGRQRVRRLLARTGISEGRTIGALTVRQRYVIVDALDGGEGSDAAA